MVSYFKMRNEFTVFEKEYSMEMEYYFAFQED